MKRWETISKRFDGKKNIIGAEVGVFKGKMSINLLESMPELKLLYLVDRWKKYRDKEAKNDPSGKITLFDKKFWDVTYKRFLKSILPYKDRVKIIRSSSRKAAELVDDNLLDFVFIDGDHSYEGVKSDIKSWSKKVKKGGYICGHDYTRAGVNKAVNEFFDKIEIDDDKTWFYKKK